MTISSTLGRRNFMAGGAVVTVAATLMPGFPVAAADAVDYDSFSTAPDGLKWITTVPGEQIAIHVPGYLVGGHFSVFESVAGPGAGTPPHIHRGADEYFFVQEGQMHFMCDGVEFDAAAGTSVVIPRGSAHSWVNLTDKPVRSLVTFTPGGIEQIFDKLAAAFPDGIEALGAKYDTFLVK